MSSQNEPALDVSDNSIGSTRVLHPSLEDRIPQTFRALGDKEDNPPGSDNAASIIQRLPCLVQVDALGMSTCTDYDQINRLLKLSMSGGFQSGAALAICGLRVSRYSIHNAPWALADDFQDKVDANHLACFLDILPHQIATQSASCGTLFGHHAVSVLNRVDTVDTRNDGLYTTAVASEVGVFAPSEANTGIRLKPRAENGHRCATASTADELDVGGI